MQTFAITLTAADTQFRDCQPTHKALVVALVADLYCLSAAIPIVMGRTIINTKTIILARTPYSATSRHFLRCDNTTPGIRQIPKECMNCIVIRDAVTHSHTDSKFTSAVTQLTPRPAKSTTTYHHNLNITYCSYFV